MNDEERAFYLGLREYLEDGFALAKRQGNKGNALGFVMAIFQKIAASSFAAVKRTLRRRLLMLTLHEAILRDEDLDIDPAHPPQVVSNFTGVVLATWVIRLDRIVVSRFEGRTFTVPSRVLSAPTVMVNGPTEISSPDRFSR